VNLKFIKKVFLYDFREAVLKAAKGFTGIFKTLTIRAKFGSEDQAMIVYDVEIPGLAKNLHAASLLSFR
jgi:hypothetical protein